MYRVFKARYFPHSDFIHASIGNNPSYTWRSILASQPIVREGLRWRVGNGRDIRIWEDKWLPTAPTHKVCSPRLFLDPDTRVCELIMPESDSWNSEVIDALFYPHEAEVIKGLPLSARCPSVKIIWAASSNGLFSVRSAYSLAVNLSKLETVGTSSDNSQVRQFWRRIWSLPVPHKLRHFVWRVCKEILPTKANLMKRKVLQHGICEECCTKVETTGHVLWSCKKAKDTWAYSKVVAPTGGEECVSFHDFLWQLVMVDKVEEDKLARIVTIAWAFWCNRNEVRNRGKQKTGSEIIRWAATYLVEFTVTTVSPSEPRPRPELRSFWTPPQTPMFKVNVDGAVFSSQVQWVSV